MVARRRSRRRGAWRPAARAKLKRQAEEALELIRPTLKRRSACKAEIDKALLRVAFAEVSYDRYPTAGELRNYFGKLACKLQRLHNEAYLLESFLAHARRERDKLLAIKNKLAVRHGSRLMSFARLNAVHFAHALLTNFSDSPPGLTREGPWHELSRTLLGNDRADLFDYMDAYQKQLGSRPLSFSFQPSRMVDLEGALAAEELRPVLVKLSDLPDHAAAAELNARRIRTPAGVVDWHPETVAWLREWLAGAGAH